MNRLSWWMLLLTLLTASVHGAEDYSDVWSHFVIFVWQYRTPPPGRDAQTALETLNLAAVNLDDGFSSRELDFAVENDYEFYISHAAGKGVLHLRARDWDPFFKRYREHRRRPIRPYCLHEERNRRRLLRDLELNLSRAREGLVLAYSFDDEISTTRFTNPADVCWSSASLAAFREWLQRRYPSLDALNTQWRTNYRSFDAVEPATVDDLRYLHDRPFAEWNLAPWADHREFMDDTLAELLTVLREAANRIDPDRPAGFTGGQAPAAYGGYDYAKLTRAVQWMEAYDIGNTNEILRSFWGTRRPFVQTFFATGDPAVDRWFLWYYLVHGNRGVIAWPELNGKPWFDWSKPLPELLPLADTFAEVQGLIGETLIGAQFDHDGIGIYYSQPSIRVSWFMDIRPHGSTWPNRLSSLNNRNASDILNRLAWTKWIEDLGLQYEFVSYLEVQEGTADLNRYRVLILPRTFALSEQEAEALREFVRRGGVLIADYGAGIFDEHGTARAFGVLDTVFGVGRDLRRGGVLDGEHIAEVNAELSDRPLSERVPYAGSRQFEDFVLYERILRAISSATYRGRVESADFLVQHTYGKGRAYYLNATPLPYLWERNGRVGKHYRELLSDLLAAAQIQPRVQIYRNGEAAYTVERLFWKKDGQSYLCLVENPIRDAAIDGMGLVQGIPARSEETLELRFAKDVAQLIDERTNEPLGSGRRFTIRWNPHEAAVLRVQWAEPSRPNRSSTTP